MGTAESRIARSCVNGKQTTSPNSAQRPFASSEASSRPSVHGDYGNFNTCRQSGGECVGTSIGSIRQHRAIPVGGVKVTIGRDGPSRLVERLHPDPKNVLGQLPRITGGLVGRSVAGNQRVVNPVGKLLKTENSSSRSEAGRVWGRNWSPTRLFRSPIGRSIRPGRDRHARDRSPRAPCQKPSAGVW